MKTSKLSKKKNDDKKVKDNVIKRIYLTRDQLLLFLDMEEKEAGEFIMAIARNVHDGKCPTFRDRYKSLLFKTTFGNSLAEQLANYDCKSEQCHNLVEQRKVEATDKADETADEPSPAQEPSQDEEQLIVTSIPEPPTEDLSFCAFQELYGRKDTSNYNTEEIWNGKTDDEKRRILAFIKSRLVNKVDVTNRKYPSLFLSGNDWK